MASTNNSGLGHGSSGSPQSTLEESTYANKVAQNESYSKNGSPINKHGDLRYSKKKTEGYLLNPNHPHGKSKAKFMKEVLGYEQADSKLFHKNVVSAVLGKTPNETKKTPHGLKHTYNVQLTGKHGKTVKANVVIVIQKDNNRTTYKVVTVYPDKKEK